MRNWSADITAVMSALEELYRRNLGLIRRIARELSLIHISEPTRH